MTPLVQVGDPELVIQEFKEYLEWQTELNRLEDIASAGYLTELDETNTTANADVDNIKHTILGILGRYDIQHNRLYFKKRPLQPIPWCDGSSKNHWVQLSCLHPAHQSHGQVQLNYDRDLLPDGFAEDTIGYYVIPRVTDSKAHWLEQLAESGDTRVDICNTRCKFHRRQGCLQRFCACQGDPVRHLIIRQHLDEEEFQVLNRHSQFRKEDVEQYAQQVSMTFQLNQAQQRAIVQSSTTRVSCIQGPPGTGKSHTLLALVRLWLDLRRASKEMWGPVIVAAPSNATVDKLDTDLRKLVSSNLWRVGNVETHMRKHVGQRTSVEHWVSSLPDDQITATLQQADILTGTSSAFGMPLLEKLHRLGCLVVIDEATQDPELDEIQVLNKLAMDGQLVLIGDTQQLGPCVQSMDARNRGADSTIMHRIEMHAGHYVKA